MPTLATVFRGCASTLILRLAVLVELVDVGVWGERDVLGGFASTTVVGAAGRVANVLVAVLQPRPVRLQHHARFGFDHPARSDSQCVYPRVQLKDAEELVEVVRERVVAVLADVEAVLEIMERVLFVV